MDYDVAQTLTPAIKALFASVFLVALGSALFFRVIPINMEHTQKQTVFYFMLFFFSIFGSFLLASLASVLPYAVVSILTGSVYLVGYYALLEGVVVRQKSKPSRLFVKPCFYVHLLFFIIISVYLYKSAYFGLSGELSRISFLTANLLGLSLVVITKIYRNPEAPTRGERVARFAFIIVVILMLVSMAALVVTNNFTTYLVISVPIQIFNLHISVLSLCALLLSDSINKHYDNSMTDALTGLPNRRYFMQQARQIVSENQDKPDAQSVASMIVADIDYFKKINDRYGHDVGDKAIVAFANALDGTCSENMYLARLGGEEFVIFLPHHDERETEAVAERLRVQAHHIRVSVPNDKPLKITASFGIATFSMSDTTVEEFLRAADRAMYFAKDRGRDAVSHYQT